MKTICIYHSRDLDGWMSAAIVKKWFTEINREDNASLAMWSWDYGDPIPNLVDYDKVIMCDISFSLKTMKTIAEQLDSNFIWIDHHKSSIELMENLYWYSKTINNNTTTLNGFRDTNFAACELTWKYFFPNEKMPEIVRLLGRYDCFGHKNTDEEQKVLEFQYGARQVINNYEEAYEWLDHCINFNRYHSEESPEQYIKKKGSVIYQYLCVEAKQIYKKAFPIILSEITSREDGAIESGRVRKFLAINQERFNPVNFGIDYHAEDYDGFACFWYKDGKWMWGLYNDNGEVDCSTIAKQYGGGGHKGASGFVGDSETMLNIINNED